LLDLHALQHLADIAVSDSLERYTICSMGMCEKSLNVGWMRFFWKDIQMQFAGELSITQ